MSHSADDLRSVLASYANEFPFSGVNRAAAAPAAFAALRGVLDECERAWTDATPDRRRLIEHIYTLIDARLANEQRR